jgi:putative membrane protein
MQKDSLEIALIKYNKKTWSKSALLGFFVGLAVIVPGISGSTVAIIFKLYDQFLYALGNLFKKFKQCFVFLLPIVLGMLVGILLGFISVKKLLELIPFAVVCLFAGLMIGAFPAVKDEIKGAKMNAKRVALFILGLLIPVGLGCFSAVTVAKDYGEDIVSVDKFANVAWWHFVLALAIGYVVGVTQIVPGLSASAFLMAVGWFGSLIESISMTYWELNPSVFWIYGGFALGFLVGLLTFSKLLTHIFGKARHTAYSMIVGLSLGSILSMFCNGDIMGTYLSWKSGVEWLDLGLGVALLAVGIVIAYLLVRYERKKAAQEETENVENS